MRKSLSSVALLIALSITWLSSCKKDDPAAIVPAAFSLTGIAGTWIINPSEGTEWEEGVGIITPKAAEPDLLNGTIEIIGTEVKVKDSGGTLLGAFPISADATNMKVTITGVGTFNVSSYVSGVSMYWAQKEPTEHSEYEENNPGQFLYFQKFWTLTKKP